MRARGTKCRWRDVHVKLSAAGEKKPGIVPGFFAFESLLLHDDARPVSVALDVDALAGLQVRIDGLSYRDQNAILQAHNDLLSWHWLVIFLLDLVARIGATERAQNHRNIAARAGSDQTANAEPDRTAGHRTDAGMMVARYLHSGDLLDHTAADFHLAGLRPRRCTSGQGKRKSERGQIRKNTIHHNPPQQ